MGKLRFTVNTHSFTHTADFRGMLDYVLTADALGYDTIRFADHVTLIVPEKHPEMGPTPYTDKAHMREIFVFMGYLTGQTQRITLATGVLALPQRQTALVAKQAAEIDILSGGRTQIGVGIGYNFIEFTTMGANFKDRARRFEEQVTVLRKLWSEPVVNFTGEYHTLEHVNINPRPLQQPIPIWFGAGSFEKPIPADNILRRIGTMADGWLPLFRLDADGKIPADAAEAIGKVNAHAREAGRVRDSLPLELCVFVEDKPKQRIIAEIEALRDLGATDIHLRLSTHTADDLDNKATTMQIEGIKRFREVMDHFA